MDAGEGARATLLSAAVLSVPGAGSRALGSAPAAG